MKSLNDVFEDQITMSALPAFDVDKLPDFIRYNYLTWEELFQDTVFVNCTNFIYVVGFYNLFKASKTGYIRLSVLPSGFSGDTLKLMKRHLPLFEKLGLIKDASHTYVINVECLAALILHYKLASKIVKNADTFSLEKLENIMLDNSNDSDNTVITVHHTKHLNGSNTELKDVLMTYKNELNDKLDNLKCEIGQMMWEQDKVQLELENLTKRLESCKTTIDYLYGKQSEITNALLPAVNTLLNITLSEDVDF